MQLVTFEYDGRTTIGALIGQEAVVDLTSLDERVPETMIGFIALDASVRDKVAEQIGRGEGTIRQIADVRLRAPIPRPPKNVWCVGKNYHAHAAEFQNSGFDASSGGVSIPDVPIIFTKPWTSICGPNDPVRTDFDPDNSVDYEGELAVVIGRGGRGISKDAAYSHIFGYTIINDVTARKTQHRHKQWLLGKSPDTFCPMGPSLVTADEVPDPTKLRLVTRVNGEIRQNASVSDLIFDIPTLIETISGQITLEPGDIIATGTPEGVGIGFNPPKYLKPGDRVAITIEPIGTLENPMA